MNHGHIYIAHRAVVKEASALPVTALVAHSAVTEPVIYAAIETNFRPPITAIPRIRAVVPAPIARSPQKARSRRLRPGARHEIIISVVVAVSPVPRRPNVIISRTNRLHVYRQRWWGDGDRYPNDLTVGSSRYEKHQ